MLIAISAQEFDADGHVTIDVIPSSASGFERRRRVNRVATLDGGAAFNDFGFSDADITLDVRWTERSQRTDDTIARFLRTYGRLNVSTPAGFFEVVPESFTPGRDESRLRMLVARRLSE